MKRSEIDHFGTSCAEFPPREMAAILHLSNHCVCSSRFFHNDITLDSKVLFGAGKPGMGIWLSKSRVHATPY
eukprot:1141191-Pelagomonas_calceolata.AAC.6